MVSLISTAIDRGGTCKRHKHLSTQCELLHECAVKFETAAMVVSWNLAVDDDGVEPLFLEFRWFINTFFELTANMDHVVLHILACKLPQALAAILGHKCELALLGHVWASQPDVVLRKVVDFSDVINSIDFGIGRCHSSHCRGDKS